MKLPMIFIFAALPMWVMSQANTNYFEYANKEFEWKYTGHISPFEKSMKELYDRLFLAPTTSAITSNNSSIFDQEFKNRISHDVFDSASFYVQTDTGELLRSKLRFLYNNRGIILEVKEEEWNNKGVKVQALRKNYTCEPDGRQNEIITAHWNTFNKRWRYVDKLKMYYDDAENLEYSELYRCDSVVQKWEMTTRIDYTFDSVNRMMNKTIADWDPKKFDWKNANQLKFNYNADGLLSQQMFLRETDFLVDFQTYKKMSFSYSEGKVNDIVVANVTQTVNNYAKFSYKYDYWGNTTGIYEYKKLRNGAEWSPENKLEFTYNKLNKLDEEVYMSWDNAFSQWDTVWVHRYGYNFAENWIEIDIFNKNTATQLLEKSGRIRFYNSNRQSFALEKVKPGVGTLKMNANTCAGELSFNGLRNNTEIIITDVNGKRVYNTSTSNARQKIDVNSYPKGIYMVTITDGSSTSVVKVVKR